MPKRYARLPNLPHQAKLMRRKIDARTAPQNIIVQGASTRAQANNGTRKCPMTARQSERSEKLYTTDDSPQINAHRAKTSKNQRKLISSEPTAIRYSSEPKLTRARSKEAYLRFIGKDKGEPQGQGGEPANNAREQKCGKGEKYD